MQKILMIGLMVSGSAIACPTKKGTMADGLLKQSPSLIPICGPVFELQKSALGQSAKGQKNVFEFYQLKDASNLGPFATNLIRALEQKGYQYTQKDETPEGVVSLFFTKGPKALIMSSYIHENIRYVAFLGGKNPAPSKP